MPSLAKPLSKKSSVKSLKSTSTSTSKRRLTSKDDAEAKAESDERITKKLKGKGKQQDDEETVTRAQKKVKEPDVRKNVGVRAKEPKLEKKVKETIAISQSQKEKKIATKGTANGKVKSRKPPTPSPESSEAEGDGEENMDEEKDGEQNEDEDSSEEEDEAPLRGFSSESDSSDEDEDIDKTPIDVGKLPTVPKDDATVKRRLEKAKRQANEDRGVLYIGRIPHGFYEDQMKAYFSQFGDVTRLRLSRNKKTGRSKHYAFIEFKSAAVAQIVAETMDNYLLMGHLLQCKVIRKEQVHPELWIAANRKFRKVPGDRIERMKQNRTRTNEDRKNVERRLLKRQRQKKRKLQALGIDYDIDPVSYSKKPKQSVE